MTLSSVPPTEHVIVRGAGDGRGSRRLFQFRELGVLIAVVMLIVGTWLYNPLFLSPQGTRDLFLGATLLAILAVGQSMVLITKNVDLSVGSIMGLSAYTTSVVFIAAPTLPVPVVMLVGVLIGVACGMFNGALVTTVRVPALVVTLGTLYVFRGFTHWWADGGQVNAHDMPSEFLRLGQLSAFGIPIPTVLALIVVVVAGLYLSNFRSGRELYAIGSEPAAARLSGIPVGRRVFTAFAINGGLAGLAGVLYSARFGTVDSTVGMGLELEVVAAAVVGGVAIFGGVGTVYGAALGAVLLATVTSALPVLRINQFWQQAVVGLLILSAIGLDRLLAARAERHLRGGKTRGA